jgi:hypothetical protein
LFASILNMGQRLLKRQNCNAPVSTPYKFYLVPNNRLARAYATWLPKCALTDLSR